VGLVDVAKVIPSDWRPTGSRAGSVPAQLADGQDRH
jgi:hypothetical protein